MAKKDVPKFGNHEIIQFVGVHDLEPSEQDSVQLLTTEYFEKIKRELHNLTNLVVHVQTEGVKKGRDKEDKRKRYSLHVRSVSPGFVFESSKNDDYELPRALHKSFEEILSQIQHRLRTDVTHPKPYQ
jgi:hypothetical protein